MLTHCLHKMFHINTITNNYSGLIPTKTGETVILYCLFSLGKYSIWNCVLLRFDSFWRKSFDIMYTIWIFLHLVPFWKCYYLHSSLLTHFLHVYITDVLPVLQSVIVIISFLFGLYAFGNMELLFFYKSQQKLKWRIMSSVVCTTTIFFLLST